MGVAAGLGVSVRYLEGKAGRGIARRQLPFRAGRSGLYGLIFETNKRVCRA
jgi:hypothetical protein